jgi:Co/Zn/Cd efflux system component
VTEAASSSTLRRSPAERIAAARAAMKGDDGCAPGDDCCEGKGREIEQLAANADQRRVLVIVLALNAIMFFVEFAAGMIAGSASLMADAVDMLGDAMVYGLSLYALNRGPRWQAGAALAKGGFIALFGLGVLGEIGVKIATGAPPSSPLMLGFGALALTVNLACLAMLWRFRDHGVNMASTFECSRNDVIANLGVLIAAAGVAAFASPWPDIAIAALIALVFLRSALNVLARAWPQFKAA